MKCKFAGKKISRNLYRCKNDGQACIGEQNACLDWFDGDAPPDTMEAQKQQATHAGAPFLQDVKE